MESLSVQVWHDLRPNLVVYKDGRVHRFLGTSTVPPSDAPNAAVLSKDVHISSTPSVSARLYLPTHTHKSKLPLLIYFHGGGFMVESTRSPTYHHYLTRLASQSSSLIVSVEYRLAPEHPLPAAYHDSWSAVLWAASLSHPWLSLHADLSRLFFAGDSAGANIAHHMALLSSSANSPRIDLTGLILVHPFFMCSAHVQLDGEDEPKRVAEKEFGIRFWNFLCPGGGMDHPWANPVAGGNLGEVGARKAVVFVAEEDFLRERGVWYVEELRKSAWPGVVELLEAMGEDHVFHLVSPTNSNSNSDQMMAKIVEFINT